MERRGFLRALGILVTSAAVPDYLPKAVDWVDKRCEPPKTSDKGIFVNYIIIQRKNVRITGSSNKVVWVNYGESGWYFMTPEKEKEEMAKYMLEEDRKKWFGNKE